MATGIKSIYQFVVTFQLITLMIFMYYFVDNGLDVTIPIAFTLYDDPYIGFSFNLQFNYVSIIGFVVGIAILYIVAGFQVVGSGPNDEATKSVKELIQFLTKFLVLSFPLYYIFGLSLYLIQWVHSVVFIFFIIHLLAYMEASQ